MTDAVFKDNEAREAIVEDLDSCILVEAGAGSGKTYSLVQRMVALVRENRCTVDRLAAVTFTRKAAAELKGRFQVELEKVLVKETDPDKKERLDRALSGLDRCFLGTIHSFCALLLRERPIEAGLDPDFEELDELEDALLQERVWEDYLNGVRSAEPHLLDDLLKIDIDAGDLKDCYRTLLTYPDVEVVREDAPVPDLAQVRARLNGLLDWTENVLPNTVPERGWDTLQQMLRMALRRRRFLGLDNDITLLRLLAALDKNGSVTQNRWHSRDDAIAARDAFAEFRDKHIMPVLRAWREHRHARIIDFVLPAVDLYNRRKRGRSKLNFQDLLMNTAALLRNNPEVRQYFQKRYTHLLVDEFQDTDPLQAEIMFYLTGQDVKERNWRKLVPGPGLLFVVGDPKQAIYRFRRADIDTYNEVKRLLARGGGKVLHLTTNFRSVKAIGDFVNPVFQSLFPEEATDFQAAFASLDTVRDNEDGKCYGVRINNIPKVHRNNQFGIVQVDAERIARWIRWAIDGGLLLSRSRDELEAGLIERPTPGDFMIILRYKAYMEEYARALEKHGIPFQIAGGNGFSQSWETAEVLKVLKVVMDPDNPVRLAAALRGGLFGLSDNQLWQFKQAGGRFNFLAEVPADLDDKDREIFEWAFGQLRAFRKWTQELPASAAFDNIMRELGVVPYALAGELGKSRSGHLMQSLELIAAAERRGITTFTSLVEYLELLMETGVEEEISIAPWEGNAVRLMNLHKAKGLEAPVVFLANPGKNVNKPPMMHIDRGGDTPRGYFVIDKKKNYGSEVLGQPLGWDGFAEKEQNYMDAEELRLLYVAATRAKNLLVVSTYPEKPENSPWCKLNGFFKSATELEDCKNQLPGNEQETGGGLSVKDLARAREGFLGPKSPINKPSYHVAAVTELVKGGSAGPARASTGRGLSWGRVIHRVLEVCAKKTPTNLGLMVENIIAEEGRAPEEKGQVLNLVEKILQSPLWQRMLKSKKRFMEVPFSVSVDGNEYGLEGETVISGTIDLVFQEGDGWVLVDYKTDTVESDEMLAELVEYYTPQVHMYKTYWEDMAKAKVHEAGLYFTHVNRWVVV